MALWFSIILYVGIAVGLTSLEFDFTFLVTLSRFTNWHSLQGAVEYNKEDRIIFVLSTSLYNIVIDYNSVNWQYIEK